MSVKGSASPRGVTQGSGEAMGWGAALWEKSRRASKQCAGWGQSEALFAHRRYQMQGTAETLPDD